MIRRSFPSDVIAVGVLLAVVCGIALAMIL